jgi:general secretion pathway protein D
MPSDYDLVRKLVEQLDKAPQQVHIAVMIAEVSQSKGFQLGVELAAVDTPARVGDTVLQGASTLKDGTTLLNAVQNGVLPGGLSIGIAHGTRLDSSGHVVSSYPGLISLDAVRRDGRFDILSETSLEAQNNKEASVNIVNQIPILKSTIQGGSGTSRDVIQNIDRIDVGIKLKLTPHIIPPDEVQMVLNPTIEAVVEASSSEAALTPTIAKREVSTTVTVPDGRMIVIAGLTRKDRKLVDKRVPLLGSIPLVGRLFRNTSDSTEKTDMLIFVTPRIVDSMVTAQHVLETWSDKTGLNPDEPK